MMIFKQKHEGSEGVALQEKSVPVRDTFIENNFVPEWS